MKSYQTLMKVYKVLKVFAKIAEVCAFVGTGIMLVGLVVILATDNAEILRMVADELPGFSKTELVAQMVSGIVATLISGILSAFAVDYFKSAMADGTPFSLRGVKKMRTFAILSIVLPLVSEIISESAFAYAGLSETDGFSVSADVTLGVGLLIVSLILKCGAELEERLAVEMINNAPDENLPQDEPAE